jgi:hypothetical protein
LGGESARFSFLFCKFAAQKTQYHHYLIKGMNLHSTLKNIGRLGATALLLAMYTHAWAADAYRSVRINFNDGNATEVVNLASGMTTTADDEFVYFHVGEEMVFSAEYLTVSSMEFSQEASIKELAAGTTALAFDDSSVTLSGLSAGATASIVAVNGMEVARATADAAGCVTLSTSNLTSGAYIISADGKTFKIALSR